MNFHNIIEAIRIGIRRRKLTISFILSIGTAMACVAGGGSVFAAAAPAAPKGLLANGVKSQIVLSWEPVKGADGYEIYEKGENASFQKIRTTAACKVRLKGRKRGRDYTYRVRAYRLSSGKLRYGKWSKKSRTTLPKTGTTTLKNLLRTAVSPVGHTMYIWGGGWNKADTGTGADGRRVGLSPVWRSYALRQKSSYNYRKTRYKRGYGLDCSGFIGWTVFNVTHTKNGKNGSGYVTKARNMAGNFSKKGWGTYRKASQVKNYRPGDIMSSFGHVYIVVGACSDKSVVLVHASPPGVQICGTATPSGKKESKAVKLARATMKKYFPSWYRRYPKCYRDRTYLKKYHQFRWKLSGNSLMKDPEGLRYQGPQAILKEILEFE